MLVGSKTADLTTLVRNIEIELKVAMLSVVMAAIESDFFGRLEPVSALLAYILRGEVFFGFFKRREVSDVLPLNLGHREK